MAAYFFDSSAIIKRYVNEAGTAWAQNLTDPAADNLIYLASITGVEVVSALTRQARGGSLSATDAAFAITQFRNDLANDYFELEITSAVIAKAMQLAETHALRGYDAVQLAVAWEVNVNAPGSGLTTITLISADAALNAAATLEGLVVDDPNAHP